MGIKFKQETLMSDLDSVAEEFKKWRGSLSYCRYPQHLWDKAHKLTEHYPLKIIASALGINVQYLKSKFSHREKPIAFASVQVTSLPPSVKIEFKQMTFQVSHEQLGPIIQSLLNI
jgi:hypothetical protein